MNCITDNFTDYTLYGAHRVDKSTFRFTVYAPNAKKVNLIGTFNDWDAMECPLVCKDGVWQCIHTASVNDEYKFLIQDDEGSFCKADPYAFFSQTRGGTNSIVYESNYIWNDSNYLATNLDDKPLCVYEMHLGSWKRKPDGSEYSYRELAPLLVDYLTNAHYTHVEFMPLTEYPLDDSWGYQSTGYFSPTSRYGTPDDLRYLIDSLHSAGIGVLLDWVPAHFCMDDFALGNFDGSCLYESPDPLRRTHQDWGTYIFDYTSPYVCSFLISSALYWLREFHFDGLRVDAVASMLYLDYSRKAGEWRPNKYGGTQNLEAIDFLRRLNSTVKAEFPFCLMIAEESTAFNGVTTSVEQGGLGFDFKWNMGWMNDVLSYVKTPFEFRSDNHAKLTFPMLYAYNEKYILPFSHDEVVHCKQSLLDKQQGDYNAKFDGLRTLTAFQYAFPGKKLNFMGNELAQFIEWRFFASLDWLLLDYPNHYEYNKYCVCLNEVYLRYPSLYKKDCFPDGFTFLQADDRSGILAFTRQCDSQRMLCVFNFSQQARDAYKLTLPDQRYTLVFGGNKWRSSLNKGESIAIPPLSAAYYLATE